MMHLKPSTVKTLQYVCLFATAAFFLFHFGDVLAATDASEKGLGAVAKRVTGALPEITRLIMGISYVAGVGFAVAGIIKFKQHKDNPAQVPLGGPIAMIFIAAALIYLPTIIESAGETIQEGAKMGSPTGSAELWKDSQ